MSSAMKHEEETKVVKPSVDPERVIEYCQGREFVLPEGLLEHLRAARHGLHRHKREVNNLSLVQATMRRLIRLRKSVDQELFMGLVVYARFRLGIHRGQLRELNEWLTFEQMSTLKSMTLAGASRRGYVERRVARY